MVYLIYFRVGKVPSVGIGALIYGGFPHVVSYGVFGKNGTQDVLMYCYPCTPLVYLDF